MNRSDDQFYDLVFPFRRVFTFEISDLETFKTEGYWARVNCGSYTFYIKVQFFEPTDNKKAYLSSSALHTIDDEKRIPNFRLIDTSHRLRVINKKTGNDHTTYWDQCRYLQTSDHDDCIKYAPFKILDWSTLLNDGFAENGSISFEWQLNIDAKRNQVWPFCNYSWQTLREHRIWGRPCFQKGLKVQTERFEKKIFEDIIDNFCSLVVSNEIEIMLWKVEEKFAPFLAELFFERRTHTKSGEVLFEIFISPPVGSSSYALVDLCRLTRFFCLKFMYDINDQSDLRFKGYLHKIESPVDKFLKPKVENDDIFLIEFPKVEDDGLPQIEVGPVIFFKSSTSDFFRKLRDRDEFEFLRSRRLKIEELFLTFALLIHNCEADQWGNEFINEDTIEDFLLLIKVLDSPEGFRRCDAIMAGMQFENDLKILKLVAQYPLPQMKVIYKKKYQNDFDLRNAMQTDDFFESLPSEFLQDLAKIHHNEIECDITLRYDSSDSNVHVESDQVVISDFKTGEKHVVNKMILALASDYFWMRFLGPHSNRNDKYVVFENGIPKHFATFLNHVYHPTNPITHHNFDALLEMAHRFNAYMLLHKLEKFLVFNENYSLTDKLKYANGFDLAFVLEFCLNSVKCFDDLEKLMKEEHFIQLPTEFKQFVQENIRWRIRTFV
ncbi:hypothetical protein CAEBREN_19217 [Caenorhabditis brenneri]|uniref:BTB domain-containing protein n=1 Tax=Caenorhabditis brenneri TaxID=135651 RepID=G0PAZ3_CAEBE|nr:hypothetical protein CAEBREN_19217 [Caenorhabditis brenneri]